MRNTKRNICDSGVTLVELIIVIVIVAVLSSLGFFAARKGMEKADASASLNRIRQSGAILLVAAQEDNGRMRYSVDTSMDSPNWSILPYNIVRSGIGLEISTLEAKLQRCEIMHWSTSKLKPSLDQRNCFGINFTDTSIYGVTWEVNPESMVSTLILGVVNSPSSYPILLDSSDPQGAEIFRIDETSGDCVGLRNSGKAHGFFLDGSVRQLGSEQLKKSGFSKVYDTRSTPPKVVNL